MNNKLPPRVPLGTTVSSMAEERDNVYALLNREKKIAKLLMAFDADYGHTVSESELNAIDPERLNRIVKAAEVNTPSAKTIDALVTRIRERDAMKGDAK